MYLAQAAWTTAWRTILVARPRGWNEYVQRNDERSPPCASNSHDPTAWSTSRPRGLVSRSTLYSKPRRSLPQQHAFAGGCPVVELHRTLGPRRIPGSGEVAGTYHRRDRSQAPEHLRQ